MLSQLAKSKRSPAPISLPAGPPRASPKCRYLQLGLRRRSRRRLRDPRGGSGHRPRQRAAPSEPHRPVEQSKPRPARGAGPDPRARRRAGRGAGPHRPGRLPSAPTDRRAVRARPSRASATALAPAADVASRRRDRRQWLRRRSSWPGDGCACAGATVDLGVTTGRPRWERDVASLLHRSLRFALVDSLTMGPDAARARLRVSPLCVSWSRATTTWRTMRSDRRRADPSSRDLPPR